MLETENEILGNEREVGNESKGRETEDKAESKESQSGMGAKERPMRQRGKDMKEIHELKGKRIFLRHAEKAYQNGAAEDKKHDPPLTEKGRGTCILKAEELIKLYGMPQIILCSPYRRCRETAEALRLGLRNNDRKNEIAILVEPKLAEYLGNHKHSKLDITEETASYGIQHPENWRQFTRRIDTYVDNGMFHFHSGNSGPESIIWIVTHGVVIGHIFKHLGLPYKKTYDYLESSILQGNIENEENTKKKEEEM